MILVKLELKKKREDKREFDKRIEGKEQRKCEKGKREIETQKERK